MSVFVLEGIRKVFNVNKNEHVVLNDINLTFPDKGFVSIVGKSGSGKSTLLNILMGIEKPTKGKILFKGRNIAKFNDRQFSKFHLCGVSTIFQHYNLFDNLTAIDNVMIPLKMKGYSASKAKRLAHQEFVKLGIEDLEKRKVVNLSGGEKQRIAIIRAIVTSPEVILCDEPTGALDTKNSREIMGILKNLSKQILIVMVSHNRELVEEFSDKIIQIKDGQIAGNDSSQTIVKEPNNELRKHKYKSSWSNKFLFTNLKKNFGKNLFSIFACSIGFASVFLCVGFLVGSEQSYEEAMARNLSIGTVSVSKIEAVEITNSSLTYQKTVRPDIYEIDKEFEEFTTLRVEENLSYFISSNATCLFNGESYTNFQMVPLFDLSLTNYGSDLLVNGHAGNDNFEEVIVNEEFVELVGNLLNKNVILKNTATTNYKTFDDENPFIKDQLIIEKPLKVVGIVKEFPFLNSPKIYYSYPGARTFLKNQFMENLSYYFGYTYSFYDYLRDANNDDPATSYSSLIFLDDLSESTRFFERIRNLNNETIEVTSTAAEIKETYVTFISSFSKTLFLFSIIAFIGINFILGMISLSSFLENRKNAAIMTCLGARNSSIYQIHLFENFVIIALSFWASLILSYFAQKLLNPYISEKFALSGLIKIPFESFLGVPFGLIILFTMVVVICSTIFTIVPMTFYRHGFLTEELRDE